MKRMVHKITEYYRGFWIEDSVGNNSFNYHHRINKRIWVPRLILGNLEDVTIGDKIVFSEIEDGIEKNVPGLKNLVYFQKKETDIFIMDNHNHAFFFWMMAIQSGNLPKGLPLVHVDMHTDMREPGTYFQEEETNDLEAIWKYTNYQLNVGNFIRPALKMGIFEEVIIIDNSLEFSRELPPHFILDIDLDIFAPEMDYIDNGYKIERIRDMISRTNFITIATSPFFIQPEQAVLFLSQILEG